MGDGLCHGIWRKQQKTWGRYGKRDGIYQKDSAQKYGGIYQCVGGNGIESGSRPEGGCRNRGLALSGGFCI